VITKKTHEADPNGARVTNKRDVEILGRIKMMAKENMVGDVVASFAVILKVLSVIAISQKEDNEDLRRGARRRD